jgi:hypothetical protein
MIKRHGIEFKLLYWDFSNGVKWGHVYFTVAQGTFKVGENDGAKAYEIDPNKDVPELFKCSGKCQIVSMDLDELDGKADLETASLPFIVAIAFDAIYERLALDGLDTIPTFSVFRLCNVFSSLTKEVEKHTKLAKKDNSSELLVGNCPICTKENSFNINTTKDIFYCFGCHFGGDVISFIEAVKQVSPLEAAKIILRDRKDCIKEVEDFCK